LAGNNAPSSIADVIWASASDGNSTSPTYPSASGDDLLANSFLPWFHPMVGVHEIRLSLARYSDDGDLESTPTQAMNDVMLGC